MWTTLCTGVLKYWKNVQYLLAFFCLVLFVCLQPELQFPRFQVKEIHLLLSFTIFVLQALGTDVQSFQPHDRLKKFPLDTMFQVPCLHVTIWVEWLNKLGRVCIFWENIYMYIYIHIYITYIYINA